MDTLKKMAYWSSQNLLLSRTIIIICQTLIAILCFRIGVDLFAYDIRIPEITFYLGISITFLAIIFYPIRRARHKLWKDSFGKRKLLDACLIVGYIMLSLTLSNSNAYQADRSNGNVPMKRFIVNSDKKVKPEQKKFNSLFSKKTLQKQFKSFVKKRKALSKKKPDLKTILTKTLQGFLILALFGIVLFFSCAFYCSGSSSTALILLIGGTSLVILLFILLLRSTYGKRKKNYQPSRKKVPGS